MILGRGAKRRRDPPEHITKERSGGTRAGLRSHLLVIEHGQHWDVRELRTLLSKTLERPQSRMHRGQIIQAPDGEERLILAKHRSAGRVRQHQVVTPDLVASHTSMRGNLAEQIRGRRAAKPPHRLGVRLLIEG